MDLQTRKIKFIQEFLKLQSEEIIAQFENLLKKRTAHKIEEKEHFKPMSVECLNNRIDQSEKDFEDNKYKTTSELLSKYS
jgi:hypothetical protein